MPNDKKHRYTEAQKRAVKKYFRESVEDIRVRVPKGRKAVIKAAADSCGKSMNAFCVDAINEALKKGEDRART